MGRIEDILTFRTSMTKLVKFQENLMIGVLQTRALFTMRHNCWKHVQNKFAKKKFVNTWTPMMDIGNFPI